MGEQAREREGQATRGRTSEIKSRGLGEESGSGERPGREMSQESGLTKGIS